VSKRLKRKWADEATQYKTVKAMKRQKGQRKGLEKQRKEKNQRKYRLKKNK